jgi:hypothetical protein
MKMTTIKEQSEISQFVKNAAEYFKIYVEKSSFTSGAICGGCLFALKWGLGNDCVLVFRLDENFEPIIFQNIIK